MIFLDSPGHVQAETSLVVVNPAQQIESSLPALEEAEPKEQPAPNYGIDESHSLPSFEPPQEEASSPAVGSLPEANSDQDIKQSLSDRALSYATQDRFELARQTAQNPTFTSEEQSSLLARIAEIEASTTTPHAASSPAPKQVIIPNQPAISRPPSPSSFVELSPLQAPSIQTVIPRIGSNREVLKTVPIVHRTPFPMPKSKNRLIFPLTANASMTSPFGWRVHPISGEQRFHAGIDLGAPMGTSVISAHAGQVIEANWQGGYGNAIILRHSDGKIESLYGHLSQVFVQPGQLVAPGQVIGAVGSTGNSTGPHLHFEVRELTEQGWLATDPIMLLAQRLTSQPQRFTLAKASKQQPPKLKRMQVLPQKIYVGLTNIISASN